MPKHCQPNNNPKPYCNTDKQHTMKETKITTPWNKDFYLKMAVTMEIKRRWEESLFMAAHQASDETYWQDAIDTLADIKLQIINQER